MKAGRGPQLDTDELRSTYAAAISTYEEAAQRLTQDRVEVHAADFGEGFTAEGARIVEALERLHGTTLSFLDARVSNWGSILLLVDDVRNRDSSNSAALDGVNGL